MSCESIQCSYCGCKHSAVLCCFGLHINRKCPCWVPCAYCGEVGLTAERRGGKYLDFVLPMCTECSIARPFRSPTMRSYVLQKMVRGAPASTIYLGRNTLVRIPEVPTRVEDVELHRKGGEWIHKKAKEMIDEYR